MGLESLRRRRSQSGDCACSVTEETGHVPSLSREIQADALDLGPHQEDVPIGSGFDELVGDGQAVDETAALLPNVERADLADTELVLQKDAAAREVVLGTESGKDDEIDV